MALETSLSMYVLTCDILQLFKDFCFYTFSVRLSGVLADFYDPTLVLSGLLSLEMQLQSEVYLASSSSPSLSLFQCHSLSLCASAVCYMLSWQCVLALPLDPFCIGCHLFCQLHFSISNCTACVCSVSCCKFSRVTHFETHSHQHTHNGPYKHTNAHSPPWQAFRQ